MKSKDDEKPERRSRSRRGRRLKRAVTVVLLGVAVAGELRKPAEERTWEGRIAGLVPYDLRRPTVARVRERLWNPDDRRIIVPTVFGVGWTVNLASLVHRVQAWLAARHGNGEESSVT